MKNINKKVWSFSILAVLAIALVFVAPNASIGASKSSAEKKIEKQADKIDRLGSAVSSLNSQVQSYISELANTNPHIRIVSPTNNVKLSASSTLQVKWRGVNLSGSTINIDLVSSSSTINLASTTPNDGNETVTIPSGTYGIYNLVVRSNSDSSLSDSRAVNLLINSNSSKAFYITSQPANIDNGGTNSFTWTTQGNVSKVGVYLYRDNTQIMGGNIANSGTFTFLPAYSASVSTSTVYRFKLQDANNSSIYTFTNYFSINSTTTPTPTYYIQPPTISFTVNGLSVVSVNKGSSTVLRWTTTNTSNCSAVSPITAFSTSSIATAGDMDITNVLASGTYSLTCSNSVGNSTTKSVKITILDPQTSLAIPTGPDGYKFCAYEGQTCVVTATSTLIYGASNRWTTPKTNVSGSISCSNRVLGDPQIPVRKACFVK